VDLPQVLVQHPTGDLGPPEVAAPERGEDDGAEQHVVHVGDWEIAVGDVKSSGGDARSAGVSNDSEPLIIVPIQLKNFTPVGTAIGKNSGAGADCAAASTG
jgi:hypothetical protein